MAEKKIGDQTYRAEAIPAIQAIELYADIMRVVTGGTGRIPAIMAALAEGEQGMAEASALAALSDVLNRNASSDLRVILERIVRGARVKRPAGDYAEIDFDEEFTGNLGSIIPVARLVLEVNYADFFPASVGSGLLSGLREVLRTSKSAA